MLHNSTPYGTKSSQKKEKKSSFFLPLPLTASKDNAPHFELKKTQEKYVSIDNVLKKSSVFFIFSVFFRKLAAKLGFPTVCRLMTCSYQQVINILCTSPGGL